MFPYFRYLLIINFLWNLIRANLDFNLRLDDNEIKKVWRFPTKTWQLSDNGSRHLRTTIYLDIMNNSLIFLVKKKKITLTLYYLLTKLNYKVWKKKFLASCKLCNKSRKVNFLRQQDAQVLDTVMVL